MRPHKLQLKLMPLTKSDKIKEELRRRWPCQEIPWGGQTELAKEYGVTRELVRQLAVKLNYEQLKPTKTQYFCICGKEMKSATICSDCRQFEIPCEFCKSPVKRSIAAHARKLLHGKHKVTDKDGNFKAYAEYTGRVFCNKICHGKWLGKKHGFTAENYMERKIKGGWNLNAPRTHCRRGHEFTTVNTYVHETKTGRIQRSCKKCHSMGKREKARIDREFKASGTTQKL